MNQLSDTENMITCARLSASPERRWSRWLDYVITIAVVVVVESFTRLAAPYFPQAFFRVPDVVIIGLAGYFFGIGPAMLALAVELAGYIYIEAPPMRALWPILLTPSEWAEFVTFMLGGVAAGVGMGMVRRSKERIRRLAGDLAEREAVLDAFFSQSPVTLAILDTDFRLVKVNPYASRLMGAPAEQLEGTLMSDVVPEFSLRMAPSLTRILRTAETETNILVSGEIPDEPGVTRHWLFSHFPISVEGRGIVGIGMIAVDITERVAAEEAYKKSEARFRTIFDKAGIGMTVVDMRGTVVTANPAFAAFVGYDQEELPGVSVEQYAYPEDAPAANIMLGEMVEGKRDVFQTEKRYVKKDGTIVWGRLTASIARGRDEEPPFMIGMIEDVTERVRAVKALEEELKHRTEFYRRTIMAATGGKLIITDREEIESLDGAVINSWDITNADELEAARHGVRDVVLTLGLDEDRVSEYTIAVGEALANAIKHAGSGIISIRHREGCVLSVVSDHGPGIEALNLPFVALERGYTTAGTLGMGFKLMMEFSDRVYLATGPNGTTVAMEISL